MKSLNLTTPETKRKILCQKMFRIQNPQKNVPANNCHVKVHIYIPVRMQIHKVKHLGMYAGTYYIHEHKAPLRPSFAMVHDCISITTATTYYSNYLLQQWLTQMYNYTHLSFSTQAIAASLPPISVKVTAPKLRCSSRGQLL